VAVESVKPVIATLELRDFCAESEEETKEEKVTKKATTSIAATRKLR
jgi:hypothetical protein